MPQKLESVLEEFGFILVKANAMVSAPDEAYFFVTQGKAMTITTVIDEQNQLWIAEGRIDLTPWELKEVADDGRYQLKQ